MAIFDPTLLKEDAKSRTDELCYSTVLVKIKGYGFHRARYVGITETGSRRCKVMYTQTYTHTSKVGAIAPRIASEAS
jgi:hypothetical protein